jgi:hypothetical protein
LTGNDPGATVAQASHGGKRKWGKKMYLFSRSRVVNGGHVGSAFTFVDEITAQATKISGVQIEAWMNVGSPKATTITWTVWLESLVQWEAAAGKLAADTG